MTYRTRILGGLTAALTTLTVLIVLAATPPATAQQPPRETTPTMLVLDASGSMNGPDPSGGSKLDAAKTALRTLLAQLPEAAQLGLTVYGTQTGNSEGEKPAGCQDVQIRLRVGTADPAGITRATEAIQARGYTPIGRALQVAAEALPAEGPRSIVLVSDGIDTCAPPEPCEIARQLAAQGVDLTVHSVGFAVDAQARTQLACIAEATGGTYTDAADAHQLTGALTEATRSALSILKAPPTEVVEGTFGSDVPAAPAPPADPTPAPDAVRGTISPSTPPATPAPPAAVPAPAADATSTASDDRSGWRLAYRIAPALVTLAGVIALALALRRRPRRPSRH